LKKVVKKNKQELEKPEHRDKLLYKHKIIEKPEQQQERAGPTESPSKKVVFTQESSKERTSEHSQSSPVRAAKKSKSQNSQTGKRDQLMLKVIKSAYLANKLQASLQLDKFRFDVHAPEVKVLQTEIEQTPGKGDLYN
jgi:hypothetical protein